MYTQCPQCLTIFQIDEDALQASFGIVQCGRCATRFDALRTLSNTLPPAPNAPLGDHHSAERVPTLTEAVPPRAAVPLDAPGPRDVAAPPGASAPDPAVGDTHAITIDIPTPEAGQSLAGASGDWFADFETELTSSLISDATRTEPDEAAGDNAWQVTDLPTQGLFSGPAPPVVVADFRMGDEELADQAAWSASLDDAGTLVSGAPDIPDPGAPASDPESVEWPPSRLAVPDPAEAAPASADESDEMAPAERGTTEDLPRAGPEPAPAARTEALPASLFLVHPAADADIAGIADDGQPQAPVVEQPEISEDPPPEESTPAHADVVSDPAEPLPPVYVRPRGRRTAGVAWALGCLVLVVALAVQVAWSQRVELFRNPATHAWTARVCQAIDCHLPPIRDVAKLELVSRDVRPDPRIPGALTITATLRNDAHFRQPWPVVVVELSDLDNNPVAMRRFRPAEYMPDPARRAAGIPPGATSAIAFEVADPGKRAVSFQFNFE